MTNPANHPDIEELVAWARGALPRKRQKEILAHCRACPDCDAKLARILVIRTRHRREMIRRVRRRRHLLLAASVVILVGVAAGVMLIGQPADPSARLAEMATTETIPESHVRFRFKDGLPASTDLRDFRLKGGMEMLARGDYSQSVASLSELNRDRPGDTEVAALLGIALYLSGDDSERTKALLSQGALNSRPQIGRSAAWYLANSCLRTGDVHTAIELLETLDLGEEGDRYSDYARGLLEAIRDLQDKGRQ